MSKVKDLIAERHIPDALIMNSGKKVTSEKDFIKRREEIKKILMEKEYGIIPEAPDHFRVYTKTIDDCFCAGKATLINLVIICEKNEVEFSFPAVSVIPNSEGRHPAFVHINFRPNVPDKYMYSEEIVDRGYATFSFCYEDVAKDGADFDEKCAKHLKDKRQKKNSPGKIAMWAWAAMRIMDYVETLPNIDINNVAVIGHSRLGKTALLAGAFDERFKYIISNSSGCSGAAISRGKTGETPEMIADTFPFWFCQRYVDNASKFELCGYDQNFLLTLSVPRNIMIGSAEEDLWADPVSEFLCAASLNEAYELYGMHGLVHHDEIPMAKCVLDEGEVLYQIRHGKHYFSREDWNTYMDFIDKKMKK